MKLAPNLEIFFKNLPVEQRLERIAGLGYEAADLFGWADKDVKAIGRVCAKRNLVISMLVATNLTKAFNDRSLHDQLVKRVEQAAAAANEMCACNLVVLSGNTLPRVEASAQNLAIIDGLKRVAPIADKHGVNIVIELLNSVCDHPGYYLDSSERMVSIVRAVAHPRIKGLYDIYHAGIMRGNIIEDIRAGLDAIGHFHIAGIPGRHEPMAGEQNYPFICRAIDQAGYKGYIGLEYWPVKPDEESLRETREWIEGA